MNNQKNNDNFDYDFDEENECPAHWGDSTFGILAGIALVIWALSSSIVWFISVVGK